MAPSDDWDHDHCAACWTKFANPGHSGTHQESFATGANYPNGEAYEWVCLQCFAELREDRPGMVS